MAKTQKKPKSKTESKKLPVAKKSKAGTIPTKKAPKTRKPAKQVVADPVSNSVIVNTTGETSLPDVNVAPAFLGYSDPVPAEEPKPWKLDGSTFDGTPLTDKETEQLLQLQEDDGLSLMRVFIAAKNRAFEFLSKIWNG